MGMVLATGATPSLAQESNILCPDLAAAEEGSIVDEYYLGKAYDEGYCDIKQNKKEAVIWYKRAAERGHKLAGYELGETYFTGDGFPTDYPEAKKWYQKAAEQGHGLSQLRLAFLNAEAHFKGLSTDYALAEEWFLKAAEQDAGDARFRLGNFYRNYKQPPDYKKAYEWLRRAAEGGHRVAMFDLGRMTLDGQGVEKNPAEGVKWIKRAAEGDLLQAQMTLAEIYAEGKTVPKDARSALTWILKIANKPAAPVAYLNKAGDIFYEGWEIVPKNYPAAKKFYERAAAKGDAHALERLADIYAQGLGVEKDEKKAQEYRDKVQAPASSP